MGFTAVLGPGDPVVVVRKAGLAGAGRDCEIGRRLLLPTVGQQVFVGSVPLVLPGALRVEISGSYGDSAEECVGVRRRSPWAKSEQPGEADPRTLWFRLGRAVIQSGYCRFPFQKT